MKTFEPLFFVQIFPCCDEPLTCKKDPFVGFIQWNLFVTLGFWALIICKCNLLISSLPALLIACLSFVTKLFFPYPSIQIICLFNWNHFKPVQRVFPSGDELLTRKKDPYVGFFNEIYLLRLASELWSFRSCFVNIAFWHLIIQNIFLNESNLFIQVILFLVWIWHLFYLVSQLPCDLSVYIINILNLCQ